MKQVVVLVIAGVLVLSLGFGVKGAKGAKEAKGGKEAKVEKYHSVKNTAQLSKYAKEDKLVVFVAHQSSIIMQHMVVSMGFGEEDRYGQYYVVLNPKDTREIPVYSKTPINFDGYSKVKIYGRAFVVSGESKYADEGTVSEVQVKADRIEPIK